MLVICAPRANRAFEYNYKFVVQINSQEREEMFANSHPIAKIGISSLSFYDSFLLKRSVSGIPIKFNSVAFCYIYILLRSQLTVS